MTIPLRHARLEIDRWSDDRRAREFLAASKLTGTPIYIGEWHDESRVSSIVARDLEGTALWTAIMAEGERDPWVVPTFGGVLFASHENVLLIGDRAQILVQESITEDVESVLIGDSVVWVVGWARSRRINGHTCEVFECRGYDGCSYWLEGDRLFMRTDDEDEYAVTYEIGGDLSPKISS